LLILTILFLLVEESYLYFCCLFVFFNHLWSHTKNPHTHKSYIRFRSYVFIPPKHFVSSYYVCNLDRPSKVNPTCNIFQTNHKLWKQLHVIGVFLTRKWQTPNSCPGVGQAHKCGEAIPTNGTLVRDSSAVRRLFVRLAGAVGQKAVGRQRNLGLMRPQPSPSSFSSVNIIRNCKHNVRLFISWMLYLIIFLLLAQFILHVLRINLQCILKLIFSDLFQKGFIYSLQNI
jgi:hypothetical protein